MMKKYLAIVLMTVFVLGVQANGESKAVKAKPLNYKEVLSKIEYPQGCKKDGIEGRVIVSLKIGTDGKVIDHRFNSYPCSDLRDAVKDILPELEFEPARNAIGDVVEGRITIPVNFELTI